MNNEELASFIVGLSLSSSESLEKLTIPSYCEAVKEWIQTNKINEETLIQLFEILKNPKNSEIVNYAANLANIWIHSAPSVQQSLEILVNSSNHDLRFFAMRSLHNILTNYFREIPKDQLQSFASFISSQILTFTSETIKYPENPQMIHWYASLCIIVPDFLTNIQGISPEISLIFYTEFLSIYSNSKSFIEKYKTMNIDSLISELIPHIIQLLKVTASQSIINTQWFSLHFECMKCCDNPVLFADFLPIIRAAADEPKYVYSILLDWAKPIFTYSFPEDESFLAFYNKAIDLVFYIAQKYDGDISLNALSILLDIIDQTCDLTFLENVHFKLYQNIFSLVSIRLPYSIEPSPTFYGVIGKIMKILTHINGNTNCIYFHQELFDIKMSVIFPFFTFLVHVLDNTEFFNESFPNSVNEMFHENPPINSQIEEFLIQLCRQHPSPGFFFLIGSYRNVDLKIDFYTNIFDIIFSMNFSDSSNPYAIQFVKQNMFLFFNPSTSDSPYREKIVEFFISSLSLYPLEAIKAFKYLSFTQTSFFVNYFERLWNDLIPKIISLISSSYFDETKAQKVYQIPTEFLELLLGMFYNLLVQEKSDSEKIKTYFQQLQALFITRFQELFSSPSHHDRVYALKFVKQVLSSFILQSSLEKDSSLFQAFFEQFNFILEQLTPLLVIPNNLIQENVSDLLLLFLKNDFISKQTLLQWICQIIFIHPVAKHFSILNNLIDLYPNEENYQQPSFPIYQFLLACPSHGIFDEDELPTEIINHLERFFESKQDIFLQLFPAEYFVCILHSTQINVKSAFFKFLKLTCNKLPKDFYGFLIQQSIFSIIEMSDTRLQSEFASLINETLKTKSFPKEKLAEIFFEAFHSPAGFESKIEEAFSERSNRLISSLVQNLVHKSQ